MARKYETLKGEYIPNNPHKLLSNKRIKYRSSWELKFMQMCDMHPNIIQWASEHEKIKIPYFNPVKNSHSVYIPDFLVVYEDKNGNKKVELVEIKPAAETHLSEAKNSRHKLALAVNAAKWKSALEWCARRNIHFRVLTENEIFRNPKRNNRARVPRNKR